MLNGLRHQLTNQFRLTMNENERRLALLKQLLASCHPAARLAEQQQHLSTLQSRLEKSLTLRLNETELRLSKARARLEAIGPMQVLSRGYALVMDGQAPVQTAAEARRIGRMRLLFQDGSVAVQVADAPKEEHHGS